MSKTWNSRLRMSLIALSLVASATCNAQQHGHDHQHGGGGGHGGGGYNGGGTQHSLRAMEGRRPRRVVPDRPRFTESARRDV